MTRRLGLVLVLATLAGCVLDHDATVPPITTAARSFEVASVPPAATAPGWTTVELPDQWDLALRRRHRAAWYRVVVPLAAVPDEPWAIYLPRVVDNAAAYVNGAAIGDGGSMHPPVARNWNRPLLFTVPAALLAPGDNVIGLRLVTEPSSPAYLRPFFVGPLAALRPVFARRLWWQVSFVQIVGGSTFAGGLLLLAFSLRAAAFAPHRWIAAAVLLWAWTTADAFFREIPIPTRAWEWSTAIALLWCPVTFLIGFHRLLHRSRPRLERGLVLTATAMSVGLALVPPLYAFTTMLASVAMAWTMGLYVMIVGGRYGKTRGARLTMIIPAVAVTAVALHDLVAIATGASPLGILLSPYLPLLAIALVAWRLLTNHLASVEATAALARTLERRVEEKHAELERHFARVQALERDQAVAAERQRIMQDVHDGVGGQIVSALALAEGSPRDVAGVTDVLRGALEDLRLVIDSLDPADCELLAVLGAVRSRLEPRLQRHALAVRWEVREVAPLVGFGPEMALGVMRVVQEAVTNVVKHARARTIVVRTGDAADAEGTAGVFVEIGDDGCGCDPDRPRGRGLSGMERRAARLGGRLTLRSSPEGTTVRLWLPRVPLAA